MSIRHRVKGFIKNSLKRVTRPQGSANTASAVSPVVDESARDVVDRTKESELPSKASSVQQPALTPKENPQIKSVVEQDKIEKHRQRVKLGLLKYINKKQGSVELAELHEFSERRYLVGHQAFSQLMEELVDGKLLDFDWEQSQASLSSQGAAFIAKQK